MGGQEQNQTVDPAIQQITEFISNSINDGEDPINIVMGLVDQEVDEQIIAQAFMTAGYKEEDVIALFEEVQKKSQPPVAPSPEEQNQDPQEIARKQAMEIEAAEAEAAGSARQEQAMVAQQDAMSQTLTGKSGIEIKPENEGKFTRWAKAHGMSVSEAANRVMSNPDSYSPSVVKMANFAKNAAGWKKEEGGEFSPHLMYKDDNTQKADTYEQHLKLQDLGYIQKAPEGTELTGAQKFLDTTGVVKRDDEFTMSPNYVNPVAFESNNNFNAGQVATLLADGYNTFLGKEDGIFTNRKKNRAERKEKKGDYYNYDITIDENDPNAYGYDNLDLFNASKNNGSLRDLQTFTDDVNENSRANYNVKTGAYDTLISSRELNEDIYGEKKGFLGIGKKDANSTYEFGENLNYFNEYTDGDTKDLILGTQDDPEGTTLGIDEQGNASSYAPGADNPYQYDTMMGYNTVGNSMIPTGSNGQPAAGMSDLQGIQEIELPIETFDDDNPVGAPQTGPRALPTNSTPTERPSFSSWYGENISSHLGKSNSQMKEIYDSIGDDEFRYGGVPQAQGGNGEDEVGPVSNVWNSIKSGFSSVAEYYNAMEEIAKTNPALNSLWHEINPIAKSSDMIEYLSVPGSLMAEGTEYFGGYGDGEFNISDVEPGLEGNWSFNNAKGNPIKDVAGVAGVEGFWPSLGLNMVTDPSSYLGIGLGKNLVNQVARKGSKEVAKNLVKTGVKQLPNEIDNAVNLIPQRKGGSILPKAQIGLKGNFDEYFQDPYDVGNNTQQGQAQQLDDVKLNSEMGETFIPEPNGISNNSIIPPQPNDPANEVTGLQSQSVDWGMGEEWAQDPSSNMQEPSFNYEMYQMSNDGNNTIPGGAEKIDGPQVSNLLSSLSDQQAAPSYNEPIVERKNKVKGAWNRFKDSGAVDGFVKGSEFIGAAATLTNNWFRDKRVNEARVDNRNNLVADEIYGTNEDPFMKRGAWDANTGTFGSEKQRTVQTNMGIARRGKEINNGDAVDIDSITLAKLIAAGADIEIL